MSSFKIHFSPKNIRKVTLPEQVTFESFKSFISQQYNHVIQSRNIQVQYRDEDQDIITVSSQLEWEEMLRGQQRYVVFVREVNHQGGTEVGLGQIVERLGVIFGQRGQGWNGRRGGCHGGVRQKAYWCQHKALELMGKGDEQCLVYARELLLKALYLVPGDCIAFYNLACVESLMGHADEAVDNLKRAINAGYTDIEHMVQDSDFENIRQTEGFEECIRFLSENQDKTQEPETEVVQPETASEIDEEQNPALEITSSELKIPEPAPEPEEEEQPEDQDPLSYIRTTLTSMGIHIEDNLLEELTERFSSDPTQIINHYFRSLY